jgi:hypothetical protein
MTDDTDDIDDVSPPPIAINLERLTGPERAAWLATVERNGLEFAHGDFEGIVYWVRYLRTGGYGPATIRKAIVGAQHNSELLATHWADLREEKIALTAAMVEQAIEATEGEVYHEDWVRGIRDV